MQQILVVANQTAVGSHLTQLIHEIKGSEPDIRVHVVVPATPRQGAHESKVDALGRPIHDADGLERADRQLKNAIASIEKLGATVTGSVGSPDPMKAVAAAMRDRDVDRIVVSTLPIGVSRWLAMDLPHRLERKFKVPVDHVTGKAVAEESVRTKHDGPLRVLLVEDQQADVALTRQAFGRADVEIDLMVAKNGAEAYEALRTYGPASIDLVLLDLKMPVVDGHEFLERAREVADLDELNVVVLTTSSSEADREKAHALGAGAYVVKDPDFENFAASIASLLHEIIDR